MLARTPDGLLRGRGAAAFERDELAWFRPGDLRPHRRLAERLRGCALARRCLAFERSLRLPERLLQPWRGLAAAVVTGQLRRLVATVVPGQLRRLRTRGCRTPGRHGCASAVRCRVRL